MLRCRHFLKPDESVHKIVGCDVGVEMVAGRQAVEEMEGVLNLMKMTRADIEMRDMGDDEKRPHEGFTQDDAH